MISECAAEDCAYNDHRTCRAAAITGGGLDSPVCETFMAADVEGGEPSTTGRVGACKMADCRHNSGLECPAPAITVGYEHDQVDCLTCTRN